MALNAPMFFYIIKYWMAIMCNNCKEKCTAFYMRASIVWHNSSLNLFIGGPCPPYVAIFVGRALPDITLCIYYSTQTRAFLNRRIHGESSCHSSGCHECCTALNTRSGCGIMMVARPSSLQKPVRPCGDPLGFSG